MNEQAPGTAPQNAQEPIVRPVQQYTQAGQMKLERQGASTVPESARFPQIRAGQCEWCGTLDPHTPGHLQYKLCPHYRGMEAKCVYCPEEKDQVEVVRSSTLNVAEHPYQRGTLIMWCNSFECSKKHFERFKISR